MMKLRKKATQEKRTVTSKQAHPSKRDSLPTPTEFQQEFGHFPADALMGNVVQASNAQLNASAGAIEQQIWRQAAPKGVASSGFEHTLNQAKQGGKPLEVKLRRQMGQAMGADFSEVRVHSDRRSHQLSQSIQAKAFTAGKNIFFQPGEYHPHSQRGQELIAHELTHVVQQNQGIASHPILQRSYLPQKDVFKRKWENKVNKDTNKYLSIVYQKLEEWHKFKGKISQEKNSEFEEIIQAEKDYITLDAGLNKLKELKEAIANYKNQFFWGGSQKKKIRQNTMDTFLGNDVDAKIIELEAIKPKKDKIKQYNPDLDWGIAPKDTPFYQNFTIGTDSQNPNLGTKDMSKTDYSSIKVLYKGLLDQRETPAPQFKKYCIVKSTEDAQDYAVEYNLINFKPLTGFHENKEDTPLFPNDQVLPKDVIQNNFADCYLQAALASIAQQKPDHIKGMLEDLGNGTVKVKLYEVDVSDENNHQFTQKEITVDKSIPKSISGSLYNRGSLWVHMIQKAYAMGGFTGKPHAPKQKTPNPSYGEISGGHPDFPYEVLTGQPSTQFQIPTKIEASYQNFRGMKLPWDQNTVTEYQQVKQTSPGDYSSLASLMQIFGKTEKVDEWMTFVQNQKIEEKINKMIDEDISKTKFQDLKKGKPGYLKSGVVTLSDVEVLFKGQSFTQEIMQWIQKQEIFPGELGTAIYSKTQMELFDAIAAALDKGKPVSIASKTQLTTLGEKSEDLGGSAGEQKFAGLAGMHVFSILGYKTTASKQPEDENPGQFRWFQLRNPWGNYSRKYTTDNMGKLKGETDKEALGNGTFWLELSDASKYFALVGIGGFASTAKNKRRKRTRKKINVED